MKNILALLTALLLAPLAAPLVTLYAADAPEQQPAGRPYAEQVDSRLTNALNQIAESQEALSILKKNPTVEVSVNADTKTIQPEKSKKT